MNVRKHAKISRIRREERVRRKYEELRKQTEKRSSTKKSETQRIRERRGGKSCLIGVFFKLREFSDFF